MMKIILTNSYYNVFNILVKELEDKQSFLEKNLIFCEDKASLMIESRIADSFLGSFNTAVYSFGNYTRARLEKDNALTKEGSTMVCKKILGSLELEVLNKGREVAPAVYEQISALKSAGVSAEDLSYASSQTGGILQKKLKDLSLIYLAYDKYLEENGLEDQGSVLKELPAVVDKDANMQSTNVYAVGFSRLTKQNMLGIERLIERGKSFTAILPYGENAFAFVNETVKKIRELAKRKGFKVEEEFVASPDGEEQKYIRDNLFCPQKSLKEKIKGDKIYLKACRDERAECEAVASIIASEVRAGKRFKDFTVVLPESYNVEVLKKVFDTFEISAFIDAQYRAENHPLIKLVLSYLEIFIKRFDREAVFSMVKNPLFNEDKTLADQFVNYVYKYNINYHSFKKPFTMKARAKDSLSDIEGLRKRLVDNLVDFDVKKFLEDNQVEDKLEKLAKKLILVKEKEYGALTKQIYRKTIEIINEIEKVLAKNLSPRDFRNIFNSGISAMKLSIIPQCNDGVFVGNFKQCAFKKAKNLFVLGLTSSVPKVSEDTTLLSDAEIDKLTSLQVVIEPKIKIINHRSREEVALSLSAFSERLYLTYPINTVNGKRNEKSQVISFFERNFECGEFINITDYLTYKQSVLNFSKSVSEFCEWLTGDVEDATSFYYATDKEKLKPILDGANSEIKLRLDKRALIGDGFISPTTLEQFYECPYKAFMTHTLGVKEREEGKVGGLEIGVLMHDIFYLYLKNIKRITDKESSHQVFLECKESVLKEEKYARYLADGQTRIQVKQALIECEKHCMNTYYFIKRSKLAPSESDLERKFYYPINDGKNTIYGKVDRIDQNGEAYRVIDYKTGKVDSGDDGLYYGAKLQLYLYSLAVEGKKLAGLYYYDVQDEYGKKGAEQKPFLEGKTLMDRELIALQDQEFFTSGKSDFLPITFNKDKIEGATDERTLSACVEYAKTMCENAVEQMKKGTIAPSGLEGACVYCKFKCACMTHAGLVRKREKISEKTFTKAIYGEDENA